MKKRASSIDKSFVLTTTPLRSCKHDVPQIPGTKLYVEEIEGRKRLFYQAEESKGELI